MTDHLTFTRQVEGDLSEATPADLAQPDSLALLRALSGEPEVIECPEDDEGHIPCAPGHDCIHCGGPAVLVDYAHAHACSEACLSAFWASVKAGEE